MVVKAQNGNEYGVHNFALSGCEISCRLSSDKRRKAILGIYNTPSDATRVFRNLLGCTTGYYVMPDISAETGTKPPTFMTKTEAATFLRLVIAQYAVRSPQTDIVEKAEEALRVLEG